MTLSEPTGGARLGEELQTFIAVLENLAPAGLFRITPSINRSHNSGVEVMIERSKASLADVSCSPHRSDTEVRADEGGRTVFLTVSLSHGLGSAVSVQWETQSGTAAASGQNSRGTFSVLLTPSGGTHLLLSSLEGHFLAMGVYQSFVDSPTSAWCALPHERSSLAMRLDQRAPVGSSHTLATLYRWQGAFVAVEVGRRPDAARGRCVSNHHGLSLHQSIRIQEPGSCVGFAVNGSTYAGVTHSGPPAAPAANLSIYKLHKDLNVSLVRRTLFMESL